ncbi:Pkinase-domain-containing protein, partial [Dissoconium aciculare CBS 342.82]|uniref:Pkinase-domain-containing protein n=1 Tax=Dissoconium aciculare CBS 342.82 TaxID=1314786 RepID=A0A6J3MF96_9PEZI
MDYGQELEAIARFSKSQYRPFFVRSEGWFETDEHICIIMELLPLGNLHHYISSGLPEAEAVMIISQVLQGLSHMHRAGYTHRDLKPQNLLIAQGGPQWKIKIADFGLSKRLTQDASSLRTVVGTAGFVAPEVQGLLFDDDSESDDPEDGKTTSYTKAVDIWAVGVITYNVLTGQLPFSTPRLLAKFVRGKIAFPGEELNTRAISEPGHRFILELLAPNPHERLGVDECLNHSWI